MSSDATVFQNWLSNNEIEKVTQELCETSKTPKVVIVLRSESGEGFQISAILSGSSESEGTIAKRFGIRFEGCASGLKGPLLFEEDLGQRTSLYLTSEVDGCKIFGIRSLRKEAIVKVQYFHLLPEVNRPEWKGKMWSTAPKASPRKKQYHKGNGVIRRIIKNDSKAPDMSLVLVK